MKLEIFVTLQTVCISFLYVSLANVYCIYFIEFEFITPFACPHMLQLLPHMLFTFNLMLYVNI